MRVMQGHAVAFNVCGGAWSLPRIQNCGGDNTRLSDNGKNCRDRAEISKEASGPW
jgi:hypothetical protein